MSHFIIDSDEWENVINSRPSCRGRCDPHSEGSLTAILFIPQARSVRLAIAMASKRDDNTAERIAYAAALVQEAKERRVRLVNRQRGSNAHD